MIGNTSTFEFNLMKKIRKSNTKCYINDSDEETAKFLTELDNRIDEWKSNRDEIEYKFNLISDMIIGLSKYSIDKNKLELLINQFSGNTQYEKLIIDSELPDELKNHSLLYSYIINILLNRTIPRDIIKNDIIKSIKGEYL